MIENKVSFRSEFDPSKYTVGCVVARFQVDELHLGQRKFMDKVFEHHKKVIIFLGVAPASGQRSNPMDFATRKAMVQELYPEATILPQHDNENDHVWSKNLDAQIKTPYGELSAVIYGSRDSFIPHYFGKFPVVELETTFPENGTEARLNISKDIVTTKEGRKGIIHAVYAARPVTYPTVDVVAYNDNGQILLGKKPNQPLYRFLGGFVDRTDASYEIAAKREFIEETNGCEIGELTYVTSAQINDWRYNKTESGIMTTLFIGKFIFGSTTKGDFDDIESLKWFDIDKVKAEQIMPEHREIFTRLLKFIETSNILKADELVK